jgi:hypothetical protein
LETLCLKKQESKKETWVPKVGKSRQETTIDHLLRRSSNYREIASHERRLMELGENPFCPFCVAAQKLA